MTMAFALNSIRLTFSPRCVRLFICLLDILYAITHIICFPSRNVMFRRARAFMAYGGERERRKNEKIMKTRISAHHRWHLRRLMKRHSKKNSNFKSILYLVTFALLAYTLVSFVRSIVVQSFGIFQNIFDCVTTFHVVLKCFIFALKWKTCRRLVCLVIFLQSFVRGLNDEYKTKSFSENMFFIKNQIRNYSERYNFRNEVELVSRLEDERTIISLWCDEKVSLSLLSQCFPLVVTLLKNDREMTDKCWKFLHQGYAWVEIEIRDNVTND